jgi:methylglutaconyl-CoA hydratase
MNESIITRTDRAQVCVLTLNRPEVRNALSRALIARLSDLLSQATTDPRIRTVVLTGTGPAFCAGMDLKEATATVDTPEAEKQTVADVQAIADLIQQLHTMPKPTIAALNGDAFAGGAGIATACDFVIAARTARIGYPEVRRGLVAAIVMHDLIRQVGARRARALLLTGEPIGAEDAERWGLVNRVVEPARCVDDAIALGHALIESAPVAVETTKRLLDESAGVPKTLRGAAAITAAIRISDEAEEGMRAFLEKRAPRWCADVAKS